MATTTADIAREIGFDITSTRVTLLDGRTGLVQSCYGSGEVVDYFDVLLDEQFRSPGREVVAELDGTDVRRIECATCGTEIDEKGRCDGFCPEMLGR